MYKNVLLTQKEIEILEVVVTSFLASGNKYEERNLTIILNRLREKNPHKLANETNIWDNNPQIT